ncbi:unnamed protein product [Boreogadus saida]
MLAPFNYPAIRRAKTPAFPANCRRTNEDGDTGTLDESQAVCGVSLQPVTSPPPAAYLNRRLTHDDARANRVRDTDGRDVRAISITVGPPRGGPALAFYMTDASG